MHSERPSGAQWVGICDGPWRVTGPASSCCLRVTLRLAPTSFKKLQLKTRTKTKTKTPGRRDVTDTNLKGTTLENILAANTFRLHWSLVVR